MEPPPAPPPQPRRWPKIWPLQSSTQEQPQPRCWPKMSSSQQQQQHQQQQQRCWSNINMSSVVLMMKIPTLQWCGEKKNMESKQKACIAIVTVLSIIFICLVATIIWLSFLPKYLGFSIEQGWISGYSFANDTLNAKFHFVLRADNPSSGFAVYYKGVTGSLSYKDATLCDNSTVPPFHQPNRNITVVGFDLVAKDVRVNGTVAQDLNAKALDLRLWSKMMMKFGGFRIHRGLTLHCKGLKVPFSSSKGFVKVACHKHVLDGNVDATLPHG